MIVWVRWGLGNKTGFFTQAYCYTSILLVYREIPGCSAIIKCYFFCNLIKRGGACTLKLPPPYFPHHPLDKSSPGNKWYFKISVITSRLKFERDLVVNLKHEEEKLSAVLEREGKDIKRLMEVINMIDRYFDMWILSWLRNEENALASDSLKTVFKMLYSSLKS